MDKIIPVSTSTLEINPRQKIIKKDGDILLCHVSPNLITNKIEPQSGAEGAQPFVYFSKGEFMSYYGDYIYLFSKMLLEEKYGLRHTGEVRHAVGDYEKIGREKFGFLEYVTPYSVYISDAVAIFKHRNLSKDAFSYRKRTAFEV